MGKGRKRAEKWRDPEAPPPSLGSWACEWMEHYLVHAEGDVQGRPLMLHQDLAEFVWRAYEIFPPGSEYEGQLQHSEAVNMGPKGIAKSEVAAAFCAFEALGPCRFDGWDASGDPVARPVASARILVLATEEGQSGNTFEPLAFMLNTNGDEATAHPNLIADFGAIDIGRHEHTSSRIVLPGHRGLIEPATRGAKAKVGRRFTFLVFEETGLWLIPELRELHGHARDNLTKRRDAWGLHATNMFGAGEGSVLEQVYADSETNPRATLWFGRQLPEGLVPDDVPLRELPDDVLLAALKHQYGTADWQNWRGIIEHIRKPSNDDGRMRRMYLSQAKARAGKLVDPASWRLRTSPLRLQPGDRIALGFDGSRRRDASALVACRLSDRLWQPLEVWEKPEGAGDEWKVTSAQVDAAVDSAFQRFDVKRFYYDPPLWWDDGERWALKYNTKGAEIVAEHPTQAPKRMAEMTERALEAVISGQMLHVGDEQLTRHALNADEEKTRWGRVPIKPVGIDPDSHRAKIDVFVAGMLAHEAACDAIALGHDRPKKTRAPLFAATR